MDAATNLEFAAANVATSTPTSTDSEKIVAPFVAKNIATRYEAWLIVAGASSSYVMTHQFKVVASDFHAGSTTASVCGNVAKITVRPKVDFSLTSTGKTFYLEYVNNVTTDATVTGVAVGGTYPAWKKNYSGNLKLGSGNKIYSDDVSALQAATTLEFYTALPNNSGTLTLVHTFKYMDSTQRSDVSFVIFTQTKASAAVDTVANLNLASDPVNVDVSSTGTTITTASVTLTAATENFSA